MRTPDGSSLKQAITLRVLIVCRTYVDKGSKDLWTFTMRAVVTIFGQRSYLRYTFECAVY
jgi:hypothetical protein